MLRMRFTMYLLRLQRISEKYDNCPEHIFSDAFEKKIEKLNKKSKHPVFYDSLQRVACILLAVLIGSGVWLTVDVHARNVFETWIKEKIGYYFVLKGNASNDSEIADCDYELGWMPDGLVEYENRKHGSTVKILYVDESGRFLKFMYTVDSKDVNWFLNTDGLDEKQVKINKCKGTMFVLVDPKVSSGVLWTKGSNAFLISGFYSESDLLKMAKNVRIKK